MKTFNKIFKRDKNLTNAVRMSIPPPAITDSPVKSTYSVWGGGYNAARGIISREITQNWGGEGKKEISEKRNILKYI